MKTHSASVASGRLGLLLGSLALAGCTTLMPPAEVDSKVAAQWHAPLPHQGTVGGLAQWWQQQGDPVLVELISAAQQVSPTVAQALYLLEASRANQAAANAALLPALNAQLSGTRGVTLPDGPAATTQSMGLQAAWELDLVGANRAVSKAARGNVQSSEAQWHDARVSVAAEVANVYYRLSVCKQLLEVARSDVASRQETARLSALTADAGLTAPAVAALARASAATSNSNLTNQAAQCALDTKALVALTAIPEPDLEQKLAATPAEYAQAAPIFVANVPAITISQRPDVFTAERDVVIASAQVGSAVAQRLPRLSLSGAISAVRVSSVGPDQTGTTWSLGPLALSLPIFDAGQRAANVKSAEANYLSKVVAYQAKVRQAVREVEEALVNLHSTESRLLDAATATKGYADSLAATKTRYQQGLASLPELEEARRLALAAQTAQLNLQLERKRTWVALYRALGGGWEAPSPA